jgi:hypothetical protein
MSKKSFVEVGAEVLSKVSALLGRRPGQDGTGEELETIKAVASAMACIQTFLAPGEAMPELKDLPRHHAWQHWIHKTPGYVVSLAANAASRAAHPERGKIDPRLQTPSAEMVLALATKAKVEIATSGELATLRELEAEFLGLMGKLPAARQTAENVLKLQAAHRQENGGKPGFIPLDFELARRGLFASRSEIGISIRELCAKARPTLEQIRDRMREVLQHAIDADEKACQEASEQFGVELPATIQGSVYRNGLAAIENTFGAVNYTGSPVGKTVLLGVPKLLVGDVPPAAPAVLSVKPGNAPKAK